LKCCILFNKISLLKAELSTVPQLFVRASHGLNRLVKMFKVQANGHEHEWSYEGECGPQAWDKTFEGARGKHQSPINIETAKAEYDESLNSDPLVIDYDHHSCSQIKNNGHTFQLDGYVWNLSSRKSFFAQ
jgi:carbonic anhydrase